MKRMIMLTKMNGEKIAVNSVQIEIIESIPESKVVMMNEKFHIVQESTEEIIQRIIQYNRRIMIKGL